jgi:hypothetical protein
MLQTIINAIRNREVLSFTYKDLQRLVHPAAVGVSRAGNDALRCYQIAGSHITPGHEWDFCKISLISNLHATGQHFEGNPPGYRKGDEHLNPIYAEL